VAQKRLTDAMIIDMAHTLGTTRMSQTPNSGVVDVNCRVHGVRGLYVAGGSVFPTSGHANPTLMILALAIRLADTLKAEFAQLDVAA
jgi:choline dehydrogenase-like flavoprotein